MTQLYQSLILQTLETSSYDQEATAWRGYGIREDPPVHASEAQDAPRPRIDSRFVPLIVAIPVFISVCVLLIRVLQPLLRYRPRWMKAFIEEPVNNPERIPLDSKKPPQLTVALIAFSLAGLALQVTTIFYPSKNISAVLPAMSWVRPRSQTQL